MKNAVESCLDSLYVVETENGPRSETALLRGELTRSPDQGPSCADVNAYKHRLHALRCENIALRLHINELETQLSQMRATRGWKLLEKIRWWRRTMSGWVQRQSCLVSDAS